MTIKLDFILVLLSPTIFYADMASSPPDPSAQQIAAGLEAARSSWIAYNLKRTFTGQHVLTRAGRGIKAPTWIGQSTNPMTSEDDISGLVANAIHALRDGKDDFRMRKAAAVRVKWIGHHHEMHPATRSSPVTESAKYNELMSSYPRRTQSPERRSQSPKANSGPEIWTPPDRAVAWCPWTSIQRCKA